MKRTISINFFIIITIFSFRRFLYWVKAMWEKNVGDALWFFNFVLSIT